jgi:hypothetical protein
VTHKLGAREFDDDATLMMTTVNRIPDAFDDTGAAWAEKGAFERFQWMVDEGAEIADIDGIKPAPGADLDARGRRRLRSLAASRRSPSGGCARASLDAANTTRGLWEPMSIRVARTLLAAAGSSSPVTVVAESEPLLPLSDGDSLPVVDGTARRDEKATGHIDERAFGYDDEVAVALRSADAQALAEACRARDPFGVMFRIVRWECAS